MWQSRRLDGQLKLADYFWLFILGVNNSGSTILSRVLEMHSSIRSLPQEGQLVTEALPRPDHLGVPRLWTARLNEFRWTEDSNPYPALQAKKDWIRLFPNRPGILLEKSPPNTVRARWLQKNFQPSRFLTIVRSPYAVCEGIRRRQGYSLEEAAQHWVRANRCLIMDAPYLEKCLWVKYEEFTANPAHCMEKIQKYLGLSEPFPAESYLRVSAHSVDGESSGIQNLNHKSLAVLSAADIRTINSIAGEVMIELGYCVL